MSVRAAHAAGPGSPNRAAGDLVMGERADAGSLAAG
jgi:hypothetical protein